MKDATNVQGEKKQRERTNGKSKGSGLRIKAAGRPEQSADQAVFTAKRPYGVQQVYDNWKVLRSSVQAASG